MTEEIATSFRGQSVITIPRQPGAGNEDYYFKIDQLPVPGPVNYGYLSQWRRELESWHFPDRLMELHR